jgi:peptidoglycan hydrolase-like protein with peptidoglycan-binding domain
MVQPKYSPEEALQRIKLMMEYDLSKTSTENKKVVLEQTTNSPFATKEEGDKFRKWFNDKYGGTARQLKLDRTGSHTNDTIKNAFNKQIKGSSWTYGKLYQYQTRVQPNQSKSTNTDPSDINSNLTLDDIKNGKSVVKLGMKGPIVGEIQKLLISKGYGNISKSGEPDSDFGSLTKGQVEKFQSENTNDKGEPLQKDGKVGSDTIKALLKVSTPNTKGLETAVKGYVPTTVQPRLRNDEPLTLLNQPIKFQQTQPVGQQTQPVGQQTQSATQQTQNVNNSVQNPELAAGYLDPNQQSTLRRRDSPLDDILKNQDINKSVCRKNISDYYNAWRTRSVVPDDVQKAAKNIVQNCAYQNYGKFGINGKRFNQMIDVLSGDARGVVGPNKSAGDGIWKIESPNRN